MSAFRMVIDRYKNMNLSRRSSLLILSVALFLMAFIPRALSLGAFLTPDEFLWADRSRNFLGGLISPGPDGFECTAKSPSSGEVTRRGIACTLRTGHPGVTTMWTGSAGIVYMYLTRPADAPDGLLAFVEGFPTNPLAASSVAPLRFTTAVITSLFVVAFFWLVVRLQNGRYEAALFASLLLALNPFHVALSRVLHHDALSTTFMTISLLSMLVYWRGWQEGGISRRWLVLSGVSGGFAVLSKSPAMLLFPFAALTGLSCAFLRYRRGGWGGWRDFGVLVGDGLLWGAIVSLTFFAFWPAMWVEPKETLYTVFAIGSKYASEGHAKGTFFMGNVGSDPGPLYYPVVWLFRSTPANWLGLIAGLVGAVAFLRRRERVRPEVPLLLAYVVLYVLFMSLGSKKQERYILPVFPVLDLLAGMGLAWAVTRFARLRGSGSRWMVWAVVIVQMVVLLPGYPYYFTCYNPLAGGIGGASRVLTLGWGEGLDVAAAYLDEKPGAEDLRVAAWYQSAFAPFFVGESISYSKEKGKALAGDYVIFYVNQVQRRYPDDSFFEYFETRFQPETVVKLGGVDYAWVYPSKGIDHYIEDQVYTGIASLVAWQLTGIDDPNHPSIPAGSGVGFDLYWEYLGKAEGESFFVRLVDSEGRVWAEGEGVVDRAESGDPSGWEEGRVITEHGTLAVPADVPPGEYRLAIGFYTAAPAVQSGELLFDLPGDESTVTVTGP